MGQFKVLFSVDSSVRTPFHADTFFGHICWAYRYLEGEKALAKWLQSFDESPTLISNAFPEDFFPKPFLKPIPIEKFRQSSEYKLKAKEFKSIGIVAQNWLFKNQSKLSPEKLIDYIINSVDYLSLVRQKSLLIPHNSYNRISGKVLEGALYDTEEFYYSP